MKNAFKRSKFKSIKTDGYDSRKESKRAEILKLLQRQGLISDLQEQVKFELLPKQEILGFNGKIICGRRAMNYFADFTYYENGIFVVEDSKGFLTPTYKQKKRLMERVYGIKIKET